MIPQSVTFRRSVNDERAVIYRIIQHNRTIGYIVATVTDCVINVNPATLTIGELAAILKIARRAEKMIGRNVTGQPRRRKV